MRRQGFSIIEVIIALGMAVIVIAAVSNLVAATHRLTSSSGKEVQATAFAKQWIELVSSQAKTLFAGTPGTNCSARTAAGFSTCWQLYPSGISCSSPNKAYRYLSASSTIDCVDPASTSYPTDQDFHPTADLTRTMTITTLARNADGSLNPSGVVTTACNNTGYTTSNDCNTKLITVTVKWASGKSQLSTVVTAWKN